MNENYSILKGFDHSPKLQPSSAAAEPASELVAADSASPELAEASLALEMEQSEPVAGTVVGTRTDCSVQKLSALERH